MHLAEAIGYISLWVLVWSGLFRFLRTQWKARGPYSSSLKQAEEISFRMEREAGLVFSVYGRAHFLWDGYWEWRVAELDSGSDLYPGKPAWFLRPEGSTANLWVRTSDQDEAHRLLENPGKGVYVLKWDEYGPGPDAGPSGYYALELFPPTPRPKPKSKPQESMDEKVARLIAECHNLRVSNQKLLNIRDKLKAGESSLQKLPPPAARGFAALGKCPHWTPGQRLGPCCACLHEAPHLYKHGDPACVKCGHRYGFQAPA